MEIQLKTPLTREQLAPLRAGDIVFFTGEMFSGRDAAHKRLNAMLDAGEPLPIQLVGQAIYYVGPCPPMPGAVIGSCGPTTSGRMDGYAPRLYDLGLLATIGKGQRSEAVVEAIRRNGAVYLAATGGAGALLASRVKKAEVVAYPDLGTEAIHRLSVVDMPLVVAVDAAGNDIYPKARAQYARENRA